METGRKSGRAGWRLRAAVVLSLATMLLAACGGNDGDAEDDSVAVHATNISVNDFAPEVRNPGQGVARLGALSGATVQVYDMHTDQPIYETTADSQGRFAIKLGSRPLGEYYRVQVRGGSDVNFDNKGTAGQAAVANASTLNAIATGEQIVLRGVSVNLLSDLLARRVGDGIQWSESDLLARELSRAVTHFFKHDIDGDGVVDYRDVLAFDPQRADHRDWLRFDWQVLYVKNSQGKSVMDLVHANDPAYADELLALLGEAFDIELPDEDSAKLVSLRFDVEGHGSLSTDAIPVTLDHESSRYAVALSRSTTNTVLVRAQPGSGSKLLAWEGCVADTANPLLCRVTPDAGKSVVAVFQDPEKPVANSTSLHLSSAGNAVGFVLHKNEAVISAVGDDPIVAKLDAAFKRQAADPAHRIFIGADRAKLSTVQVSGLQSRVVVDGVVRYVMAYVPALVTDALESGSAYAPTTPISVDTISAMSVNGATDGTTQVQPGNEANGDFVAGPNPVDPALDTALCGATKTQHRLVDGTVACIAGSNLPVQNDHGYSHACAAGEALVETVDGEDFCVSPSDVHTRAAVNSLRSAMGSTTMSYSAVQSGRMRALALQQPVQTSTTTGSFKPGEVVWLVGQGKAIYLARNVFMVDMPDGKGVRMVTASGDYTAVDPGSRAPMAFQRCVRDATSPECGFFEGQQIEHARTVLSANRALDANTPLGSLIPDIRLVISPEKYPWISVSFLINVDLVGSASANLDWGVLWYAFGSRGRIEVAPIFNTKVTADGLQLYKRPAGSTSARDREVISARASVESGEPIFEKDLFRIDFLQKIPAAASVSPVLESALRFAIGVDAAGQATIEIETSFRQVVAWDVKSEFTYYVFSSNHNLQSFKIGSRSLPGMKLKIDANAAIGMYAKAAVSMGPRGIMPELATLQARYYLYKLEALGKLLLSYQTEPAKVAAQSGQNFCWAGAVSMTLKRSFDITATINLKPSGTLGDILKYIDLPRWDWTLYSWDGIILNVGTKRGTVVEDSEFPSDVDIIGVSTGGESSVIPADGQLACPTPSPSTMPAEREYTGGKFKLDAGHSIYTKTHEFTMQEDGNFVVYRWNGSRGAAVWATGSQGKAAVAGYNQFLMQDDGNLVVRDIVGNTLWSLALYRTGGTRLKFASDGSVEVWSKNARLWSSSSGLNRSLPGSLTFKPGEFVLDKQDGYHVRNRALYLDARGGFRWLRTTDNRDAGAVWSYCNNNCDRITFQPDGNLLMLDKSGAIAYQTVTANKGVTHLTLEGDGRFVLFAGSKVIWTTER